MQNSLKRRQLPNLNKTVTHMEDAKRCVFCEREGRNPINCFMERNCCEKSSERGGVGGEKVDYMLVAEIKCKSEE